MEVDRSRTDRVVSRDDAPGGLSAVEGDLDLPQRLIELLLRRIVSNEELVVFFYLRLLAEVRMKLTPCSFKYACQLLGLFARALGDKAVVSCLDDMSLACRNV